MKTRRAAVGLALSGVLAGTAVSAPPAQAASTVNVTVKFGNWNCVKGGTVASVAGSIVSGGTVGKWRAGNSFSTFAYTGKQQVVAAIYCSRPWYQGGWYMIEPVPQHLGDGGYRYFHTNGQVMWI